MEKAAESGAPGSKRLNLKKSFKQGVRPLLTAFPFEDFSRAFPKYTGAEQDRLYQLYIQVITSLHENMQDEFDSLCQETQVGTMLDTVEHFVEQQSLDPLFAQKTNVEVVKHDLLAAKRNEIHLLESYLDKIEDERYGIKDRINLLKKKHEVTPDSTDALEKLRSIVAKYGIDRAEGVQDEIVSEM